MARWLFKEEPTHFCFSDLIREGKTVWNGVTNALARQHLRQVKKGDRVWFYHTGKDKAIVGEMRVVTDACPDVTDADPKAVVVEVEPVKALAHPVTLETIKADPGLADWDLVRLPRLSVLPVTLEQWRRIEQLSKGK
ncbi:MAG: EVE domain-containing protein [Gemmataceae bacterium]